MNSDSVSFIRSQAERERNNLSPRQKEIREAVLRRCKQIVPTIYHFYEGGEVLANLALNFKDDEIALQAVITDPTKGGRGNGTQAMKMLMEVADEQKVAIRGVAKPCAHAPLTKRQLMDWYARIGFTVRPDGLIEYLPK